MFIELSAPSELESYPRVEEPAQSVIPKGIILPLIEPVVGPAVDQRWIPVQEILNGHNPIRGTTKNVPLVVQRNIHINDAGNMVLVDGRMVYGTRRAVCGAHDEGIVVHTRPDSARRVGDQPRLERIGGR